MIILTAKRLTGFYPWKRKGGEGMTKKQLNGLTYILGSFDEVKQFCDANNLTMLKVPQNRLTEQGKALFENYEYYTTIQN